MLGLVFKTSVRHICVAVGSTPTSFRHLPHPPNPFHRSGRFSIMPWSEDFSEKTFGEIVSLHSENVAWYKELRLGMDTIVNSRLARNLTQEEYASKRSRFNEDVAEYERRRTIINRELTHRESGSR